MVVPQVNGPQFDLHHHYFNLNRFSGLNETKERAFVADFFVQPELLLSLRPGRVVQNHGGHASHVKQGRELLRIFGQDLIQP